jgi:hypothetical protein
MNVWPYIAVFALGMSAGMFIMVAILRKSISNNSTEIIRPKIKNSPNGIQQLTAEQPRKRKFLNFKNRRNLQ